MDFFGLWWVFLLLANVVIDDRPVLKAQQKVIGFEVLCFAVSRSLAQARLALHLPVCMM